MVDFVARKEAAGPVFGADGPRLPNALAGERSGAVRPAPRKRLAIISSYHELCGIAAYTRRLEHHLGETFEVTIFDLDQYLLRGEHPRVRRLGDRHIKRICRDIATFDAVNLQLEHGLLGRRPADIYRRFCWLLAAAPNLTVTFHTMFGWAVFDGWGLVRNILTLRFRKAYDGWAAFLRFHYLAIGIPRRLRRAQRYKPVRVIVHNRRDRREMTYIHALKRVHDHPLSYLGPHEAARIRAAATRRQFPLLDRLPDNTILIGVFGFLSRYKGFETAIRAMQHLPEQCHLLVFGNLHPNEIVARQPIDPYLSSLLDEAYADTTLAERAVGAAAGGTPALTFSVDRELADMLTRHPKDLSARLHFMGAMRDEEFLTAMAICDTVVFPYLEVGQSSSGPISQALELGCRIIASRTRTFLEFARYHPDRIEFFDIGNHLELAQRLAAPPQYDVQRYALDYDIETNKAMYRAAVTGARPKSLTPREDAARAPAAGEAPT